MLAGGLAFRAQRAWNAFYIFAIFCPDKDGKIEASQIKSFSFMFQFWLFWQLLASIHEFVPVA